MAQSLAISDPQQTELLLILENGTPLPALLASELLSILSKDYRRQNRGRTLVVSRLASGSLWIYLSDLANLATPYAMNAVDAAKGGKAILEFGKAIRDAIITRKEGAGESGVPTGGLHKSVECMVKVAAETGSHIKVRQTGSDGSLIEVELSPMDAAFIKERSYQGRPPSIQAPADFHLPSSELSTATARIADRFVASAHSDSAIEAIVESLVLLGSLHIVEQLVYGLESRGYYDLALKIKNIIQDEGEARITTY